MSKILKFKRGTTAKNNAYVGSDGELTVDTNKKTIVVHDGLTNGGSVLATELIVSNHTSRVDNPHNVTKSQVGLGNVQNIDSTIASNISQDSTHRFVTDSEKTMWNNKINLTEKASANGVATLDSNGKVVLTQIPDSVLGQLQYMGVHNFSSSLPTATEKGQYWIASFDGNGYITGDWAVWNGTSFDKVDNTDAVATVAGRTGNVVLTKNDVGLNNVDNTSDVNKPVSTAQQTALNLKANIASPTFTGTVTAPAITGALNGNASTATKLATARTIGTSGDVTTTAQSFDGSANITIPMTLATVTDSGTGTFKKVTVDTKGRVTGTAAVAQADITGLLGAGSITNAMLSNGSVANLSGINTGDQTITLTGDVAGTGTGSFATTLANSGVTAGTYKSVTVDVKGRVTAGTNPTTISGYGITDAQPLDGDLTAIAGLAGTSGILKKTAVDTWVLDTNTYVTSSGVTSVTGTAPIVSSGGNTPSISISAATTSAPGSMSAADKTKLDGIATGANNYVLPTASSTVKGGVELFSDTVQSVASNAVTSTASRTYGVQLNSDGQAVVNVPWVDTNTVYTHPTGDGNLHVPATGTTNNGKVLMAGATAGSLSWTAIPSAPVSSVNGMTGDVTVTTITGNAGTATKLQTTRSISLTGDVTGTVNFDGSADASITTTIAANSVALGTDTTGNYVAGLTQGTGITVSGTAGEGWSPTVAITNVGTAGTYTKVTTNAQGQVTAGAQMTLEDIPDSTFKKSVRCATTANLAATYASNVLTMSAVGVTTIDGITVALNDRVLIKDQTTALQNGIYRVSTLGTASVATVFTRVSDADATSELASAIVAVDSGTVNGGRLFDNDLKTTDTIGTTAVNFNLVVDTGFASTVVGSAPGTAAIGTSTSYARADHVHPVQTTISGNAGTATTLQTARTIGASGDVTGTATSFNGSANITIPLTLSNSGVTSGTYRSITVDSKGRVTTGSNPTTISEYCIVDAYTKTEVGTLAEFTAALG